MIPGFHPDPSVCRDGDDYYLATSTFEYFPGVPIYHSKDLVHWRLVGHALDRPSQLPLAGQKSSMGIFAPTLRCGNGRFYMVTTNVGGGGNFIVSATSPAGPWSEPVRVKGVEGIDPSLFFDDDGKVYLTHQDGGERGGISQVEIDVATGRPKGEHRRIWNGTGGVWPEGPHLYKVNGWYYLLHAEGGTSYGHVVILARSRSPWGPFEGAPGNPILTHRDRPDLQLQALGHADLVQTPAGKWFMVLLGVRHLKHKHHLGRETLLAPVEWTADGWLEVNGGAPLGEKMTAAGLPAPHPWPAPPVRDDFSARTLGPEWIFLRGPAQGLWSLAERPGALRLKGTGLSLAEIGTPAFVGRRQAHLDLLAATLLDFAPRTRGQEAGLALRMNEDNHYQLLVAGTGRGTGADRVIRLVTRIKGVTKVVREAPLAPGKVELSVRAAPGRYVFGYRVGGREVPDFGSAPTAPLSSEDAGGFTGVIIGMVAHAAGAQATQSAQSAEAMPPADFDWFDYRPIDTGSHARSTARSPAGMQHRTTSIKTHTGDTMHRMTPAVAVATARKALAVAVAAAIPLFAPALAAASGAPEAPPEPAREPWLDRSLSADQRARLAVQAMTQQEKLRWVMAYFGHDLGNRSKKIAEALPQSAGYVPGTPRLGLPALFETDAGLGVASQSGPAVRERTALPSGLSTASTWDPKLAYGGGAMIGSEARASGFNVMLAGGVNLQREALGGRNFEYAGEDPLLSGVMVGHAIRGIESNHIISTLKHFVLNDQETGRNELDARIDKAALRMSDLLAMELALEQSDAGSVMCAYNRLNGPYACESDYLLNEVLKRDWGFRGFVMSDWGATHSTVAAANNGLDQQSGHEFDKSPYFGGALEEAVKTGAVPQARLDDMVLRIVRTMFAKGVVDHPVKPGGAIDFAANGAVSRQTAEAGMVLLKNEGRILPLARTVRSIAVIGGHADVGVLSGGGSSQVYPVGGMAVKGLKPDTWPGPVVYYPSSPLRAIRAQAPGAKVVFDDGRDPARAARVAAEADVVLVFATQWIGEANDAESLVLPDRQDELIASVAGANARTVVVLETGGPVAMPWLARVPAVLEAWYPGTSGGEAIANVLFGVVNPSGHLPATFPASEQQLPRPKLPGDRKNPELQFAIDYHEGAAVGYKWFDLKGHKPLFPFGHGLSYTSFAYSGLSGQLRDGRLHVRFKVTNTGNVAGKDVPQLYASPLATKWEAPKRLAGWGNVNLQPGETREVELTVEPRVLAMFDEATRTWRRPKGKVRLTLAEDAAGTGASSVTVDLPASTLDVRGRARTR